MSRLRSAVLLLAVGAVGLAGCGDTTSHGGLYGPVTVGPTSPVCRTGTPCSMPAGGARLTFTPDHGSATNVVVGKDGSYSVSLAPGTYYVVGSYALATTGGALIGRGIDPNTVRVVAGPRQERDFRIDTGIR